MWYFGVWIDTALSCAFWGVYCIVQLKFICILKTLDAWNSCGQNATDVPCQKVFFYFDCFLRMDIMYQYVKRVLDIVIAVLSAILLSPLMAVTAIAVKAESEGPALFKQDRLGKAEKYLKYTSSVQCSGCRTYRQWCI